ncbi:ZU5 domain protein [Teladorsagia circumcincta]|uniref:ZU5 domain protein n=1 Tax=Teladorsagia circumcincta TaxID=45464 RepID=A0A2G9V5K7_TELCI|nr:ZU5 domain protein [Teladorsagia circumcincta]
MPVGEYEYYSRQKPKPDQNGVRTVNFRKVGGSVGIRVIGGNEVGIFVSAVAADSPAALHGVCCGDRIVEVNGRSMRGVTRESAVQLLLALDDHVSLRLEHARQDFEHVRNSQLGDNFYIRSHFTKEKKSSPLELSVSEGDIFHVTDTLFGGTVGLWQASRVYSANANKGEPPKGVIPNQVLLFPLSSRGANYDSDMESLKGDYADYSMRSRDESVTRGAPPPQMVRSIYDWDNSQSMGAASSVDSPHLSELTRSAQIGWVTLPRRSAGGHSGSSVVEAPVKPNRNQATVTADVRAAATNPLETKRGSLPTNHIGLRTSSNGSRDEQQQQQTPVSPAKLAIEPTSSQLTNGHEPPNGRHPSSPGYYHVKQLLNDDSLYHDARLANEIANVRLREEARIRDDRLRGEQRLHDRPQVPLQPPNPDMYSPREEKPSSQIGSTFSSHSSDGTGSASAPPRYPRGTAQTASVRPSIAPKPHLYTDSVVRNGEGADVGGGTYLRNSEKYWQTRHGLVIHIPPPTRIQDPTIVEETNAVIGHEGGVLNCPASGVELRIPKGAIPPGETHEIYVKVCRDGDSPPIDKSKGETLLSPLVMCGPQGLTFLTPCELRLPHCGPMDSDGQWSFSLKAGEGGEWQHMDVQPQPKPSNGGGPSDRQFLSVMITHF